MPSIKSATSTSVQYMKAIKNHDPSRLKSVPATNGMQSSEDGDEYEPCHVRDYWIGFKSNENFTHTEVTTTTITSHSEQQVVYSG